LLIATTGALWQWYVFLAINAVVRGAIFYIPFQVLIARWFSRRRATAIAILGAGLWSGSVVMVPIMQVVIDAVEWDGAFVFSGVLIAVLFVPLGLFVIRDRPPPDAWELQPASENPTRNPVAASRSLTLRQAVRTPTFWIITLAMMTFFYGVVGWLVHAVPYYESVGLSTGWAAGLVSLASALAIVALLIYGRYADRIERVERPAAIFTASLAVSMLILLVSGGATWGIALFIVFFVLGFAGGPLLEPLLLTRAFGLGSFATILGAMFMLETSGLVVAPAVAGAIFDATDSYDWALVMFAISAGLSVVMFLLASRMPRPLEGARPSPGSMLAIARVAAQAGARAQSYDRSESGQSGS
jgi:MFS family permease